MNKTQLIADITSKVLKVVSTVEEVDSIKNAAGVRSYMTNVIEQDGDKVKGRNIGWYTIDEGTGSEAAFYRDIVVPKSAARDAVISYLVSKTPSPYIRFTIESVNEEDKSARATVIKDNGNSTATETKIFIFKNGNNPITHVELT